jgi:hypothetical protein
MTSGLLEQELKKEGFLKTQIKRTSYLAIKAAQDLLAKEMLIP